MKTAKDAIWEFKNFQKTLSLKESKINLEMAIIAVVNKLDLMNWYEKEPFIIQGQIITPLSENKED